VYGEGRVFQLKDKDGSLRSRNWYIRFSVNGRERQRVGGATEKAATKALREELAARDAGLSTATEDRRLTVSELLDTYEAEQKAQQKKSLDTTRSHLKPIRAAFEDRRALSLRAKDFEDYRARRTVSRQTIDRELTLLRAAFNFAKKVGQISRVPYVPLYHADNVRQGFTDRETLEKVASSLRPVLADVARFAYFSAWRRGEVVSLRWSQVDRKAREVRLGTSKNGKPRTLPLEGVLWTIIERRSAARRLDCPFVFHEDGQRIGDFRKAWAAACKAAGVPELLFHDLRRSGVRNLIRAGVPQSVAMSISGHNTISTFIRYDIAGDEDKREALRAVAAGQPEKTRNVEPRC
jgi:integrase